MTHLYILKMLMVEIEIICFNFRAQDNSLFDIKIVRESRYIFEYSISFKY